MLVATTFVASMTHAQSFTDGRLSIRGGLNFTNANITYGMATIDAKSKAGFHLGVSYDLPISKNLPLSLETGLYATTKGWKFKEDFWDGRYSGDMKTNLFYLQIPVLVGYTFTLTENFQLKPFAGFTLNYGVSGKEKIDGLSVSVFKKDEDGNPYMKRGDIGFKIGVGANIFSTYYLGLGYEFGVMNATKEDDSKIKNSCFSLSVGYNF